MLFAPHTLKAHGYCRTDPRRTKAASKSLAHRTKQKITPLKLAQSYINIRRHYTTPHGLIDV